MKFSSTITLTCSALAAAAPAEDLSKRASVQGFDISHYQSSVNYAAAYNTGDLRFAYIKATENTTYKDLKCSDHYTGTKNDGFIRGADHFGHSDTSAATQANFFPKDGGDWSNDGKHSPACWTWKVTASPWPGSRSSLMSITRLLGDIRSCTRARSGRRSTLGT